MNESSLRLSSSVVTERVTERVKPANTAVVMRQNGRVSRDAEDGIKFLMLRKRNAETVRKAVKARKARVPAWAA